MKLYDYVRGLWLVATDKDGAKRVLSLAVSAKIPFGKVRETEDGGAEFSVRPRDIKKVRELAERANVQISARQTGLPALIKRYRRRLGVPIGAATALFAVFLSSRFVWDVHISGNVKLTETEIEEVLQGYGFGMGTYLPSVNLTDICRRAAAENDDISWISVNMSGTVAYVEVREAASAETEQTSEPSNLIAECDGQIVLVEAIGGKSEVTAGQTVKKGDILVSGVIDSPALGYRLVRSRGRVLANVSKTFSAEISLKTTEKVYTGSQKTQKSVSFFSKNTEITKKDKTFYEKYDKMENTERLSLFGVEIPVFVTTVTYAEYVDVPMIITEKEATELARRQIISEMATALSGDEILTRYEDVSFDGERVTVTVVVECVSDIAREQKIQAEQK